MGNCKRKNDVLDTCDKVNMFHMGSAGQEGSTRRDLTNGMHATTIRRIGAVGAQDYRPAEKFGLREWQ
jgi:hypothetical protein